MAATLTDTRVEMAPTKSKLAIPPVRSKESTDIMTTLEPFVRSSMGQVLPEASTLQAVGWLYPKHLWHLWHLWHLHLSLLPPP